MHIFSRTYDHFRHKVLIFPNRFFITPNAQYRPIIKMGSFFTNLLGSEKKQAALMLGLDGAGKSTILYKLRLRGEPPAIPTIPTLRFSAETIEYQNVQFSVWDVATHDKFTQLWKNYHQKVQTLIYVVDSSDRDRIDEARLVLHKLLNEDEFKDAVLLVLANKQDLRVMSRFEVAEKLALSTLKGRIWNMMGTCALTGDGLLEGFQWIHQTTSRKK